MPIANYSQEVGIFPANAAAAIGQLNDLKRYTELTVGLSATATETVTAQISLDNGLTWSATNLSFTPIAGGAAVTTLPAATAAAYWCRIPPCTNLRLTKSGAADSITVQYALRWA